MILISLPQKVYIADNFNKFFMNAGVTLASKFSTDTSKINPHVSEKHFTFSKTDAKCVEDHIKNLKMVNYWVGWNWY